VNEPESYLLQFVRQIDTLLNPGRQLTIEMPGSQAGWGFCLAVYEITE
jgi:hypothetical protein